MQSLTRQIIVPVLLGLGIFTLLFGTLPLPNIQAVAAPSHPNDIFVDIYQAASPSVVAINARGAQGSGNGSGFVIDQAGHIVTNAHVVDSAEEIIVEFLEGAIVRAEMVGLDLSSDIAVIKVDVPAETLRPLAFADSNDLTVGETVLAIGSPFRQGWTLTSGIVSAVDRTIRGLTEFWVGGVIQTDASINPGNSGGPLLNLAGEVIGVNSQIISSAGSSAGVGFAIPANLTRRVAQTLIEDGEIQYSYLGIRGEDVNLTVIEILDLPSDFRGVVVEVFTEDGPAANSELQERAEMLTRNDELVALRADIITAIDGAPIKGMNDLISYLARYTRPEQEVMLTVLRDGEVELEIPVTLGQR